MLKFLFPRLTADPARGAQAFAAVTALARDPAYYRAGEVADTLDGRFAVLATITALALVRIEREGAEGNALSVALTERFIEVMEAEHRELGMSDPTLGKTVRKLVALLARRVDLWRDSVDSANWDEAARDSLFGAASETDAAEAAVLLRRDWDRLTAASLDDLAEGKLA